MHAYRPAGALAALALLLLTGCLETVNVTSTPPGAAVLIDARRLGVTPIPAELEARPQPYQVTVTKDGYEPETVAFTTGKGQKELEVALAPLTTSRRFALSSDPTGATVTLDGKELGRTPLETELTFRRASKTQPWQSLAVAFALPDHQTETISLNRESVATPPKVDLARLRLERTYHVAARWAGEQAPLKAALTLDGTPVARTTPADVHVVYQRPTKDTPWPTFRLRAEVPTRFQPHVTELSVSAPDDVAFELEPLMEIAVTRINPRIDIDPNTGAVLHIAAEEHPGMIDVGEHGTEITGLTRITDFPRRDTNPNAPAQYLTSFALVPKGDAAVLAIATPEPRGGFVSGLRLVRTDGSFTPAMLTDGARYFDTAPVFSRYEQGTLTLIFQSNRADRARTDIFRLAIDEKSYGPVGGIARITSDQRFNYAPTLADTAIGIVYLSVEPNYPLARPQLSTVKADGVLPTQFPITALEVAQREMSTLYFVREDSSTHKRQIFSVQPDGKLETALTNDPMLASADCTNPSPAFAKNGRLLFVADAGTDEHGRHNNDIYVMNADGSNVQRLTANGSDDLLPAWSPADDEPGVFYFMSNRGGAYNLWRAKIADLH